MTIKDPDTQMPHLFSALIFRFGQLHFKVSWDSLGFPLPHPKPGLSWLILGVNKFFSIGKRLFRTSPRSRLIFSVEPIT